MTSALRSYVFLFALYALMLIICGYTIDNDTYYLLALGRSIHADGIPTTDPLIMDGNYPVVIQQWLYAFLLWSLYQATGLLGTYLVSMAAGFLILLVFYRLCVLVSDGNIALCRVLTVYFALFFYPIISGAAVRPQVFSSALLICALFLLERVARGVSRPQALLSLVPLSILLINLHAAMWPFLPFLIGVYLLESLLPQHSLEKYFLTQRHPEKNFLLGSLLAVLLAGLLNPYGSGAMLYSLQAAHGVAHFHDVIGEMWHLSFQTFSGSLIIAVTFLIAIAYARHASYLRYLLLSLTTILLSFESLRSSQHLFLFGFFPLAFLWRDIHSCFHFREALQKPPLLWTILLLLVVTALQQVENIKMIPPPYVIICISLGLLLTFWRRKEKLRAILYGATLCLFLLLAWHGKQLNDASFPALTAIRNDIDVSPQEVRLYADFTEGAPAEFFGFKPYMDTRPEIFAIYGHDGRWNEFYQLLAGRLYYQDFLDVYRFDYLIMRGDTALAEDMKHATGYTRFFEDKTYVVYKRHEH